MKVTGRHPTAYGDPHSTYTSTYRLFNTELRTFAPLDSLV